MATVTDDSRCSGDPKLDRASCGKLATNVVMTGEAVAFGDEQPANLALLVCDDHYGRGRLWLSGYASGMEGHPVRVITLPIRREPVVLPANTWVLEAA